MVTGERRLILDRSFDRAVDTVLDAFLHKGFTIRTTGAGDLHRHEFASRPLRYAVFEATLPEMQFVWPGAKADLLGCRLSLFELAGSCTLLTAESRLQEYPTLGSLLPRVGERIGAALRLVTRAGILNAA